MADEIDEGLIVTEFAPPPRDDGPRVVHVEDDKSRDQLVREQFSGERRLAEMEAAVNKPAGLAKPTFAPRIVK